VSDRCGAGRDVVECRHQQLGGLRPRQQPDRDLDDDAEHPFRAAQKREQRQSRSVARGAAHRHELAFGRDEPHLEQVLESHAVLEAMHATGILRDVSADRADELRRRVGRVVEAVRRGGTRNREVWYAGLDARDASPRVDLEDPVEPGKDQQAGICHWQRAAREPGACAACDDRARRGDALPA
jgi:hypothetical protein